MLPADRGMLFVYDHNALFPFWMHGMRFPLDFIWIDGQTVVDLHENVPPPGSETPAVVRPRVAVDKILEVNAGDIKRYGIRIGDRVEFGD